MICELWSPRVNSLETTNSSSEEFPTVLRVALDETETTPKGGLHLLGRVWGIN